jgi:putative selenium metabolism hydrolase
LSSREIAEATEKKKDDIVNLLKRLIATPSLTGHEGDVARLLKQEMITEGFDARIDQVGNVVGIIKGKGDGRTLLYNGHMDHVPPGTMLAPYSAEIRDGEEYDIRGRVVYGRGASDMKGALAAMTMAGSVLKELGLTLRGTLIITGTVFEEELGNIGPPSLIDVDGFRPDAAVVGECTNLDLALGNRGVVRTRLTTFGKSSHASVQERGINALYKMAKLLGRIQETNMMLPSHPVLGKASWVVCKMEITPNVVNIVPERCEAVVDTRIIPNFTPEMVMDEQRKLVDALERQDHEFKAKVAFSERDAETWTGYKFKLRPVIPSFYIQPDHWLVEMAAKSLSGVLGRQVKQKIWGFTTESYCFMERGIPTIGFGPGEERFTHSEAEVLSVEDLITATKAYAMLAVDICGLES